MGHQSLLREILSKKEGVEKTRRKEKAEGRPYLGTNENTGGADRMTLTGLEALPRKKGSRKKGEVWSLGTRGFGHRGPNLHEGKDERSCTAPSSTGGRLNEKRRRKGLAGPASPGNPGV